MTPLLLALLLAATFVAARNRPLAAPGLTNPGRRVRIAIR
jgi:hypothetical protein